MIYLGKTNGNYCRVSKKSQNNSILVTGISGSGKTCRMQTMELDSAKNGHIVVILDTADSHTKSQIFPLIRQDYLTAVNHISAVHDGIDIPLFRPLAAAASQPEPDFSLICTATNAIARPLKLGALQTGILRNAIQFAIRHQDQFQTEMQAVSFGLQNQNSDGKKVYQRLWNLFNCGVIRKSQTHFQTGKINILDFGGLDSPTKNILIELILTYLFKAAHSQNCIYDIFIDECQNFNLKTDSAICQLLREGRKFDINLILSTQSLSVFNREILSMLNQASTKLYFQPSLADIHKIAKQISCSDWKKWKYTLSRLNVGESIAYGYLSVENAELQRPILLR